jgi:hypothetical protein
MSLARFGFEDDSLYTFQNNYFYTIGIITFGLTLINASILYLIGTNYLALIKNKYEKYIFGFVLIYVSLLFGFLSIFIIPSGGLIYFLSNLRNERIIKKIENVEEEIKYNSNDDTSDEEIIKQDNLEDTSDEETKNEDIQNEENNDEETSDEETKNNETSDEEITKNEDIKNEETSDDETSDEETSEEENGQNCRGCGCFLVDGTECVQPNSSKAYCQGCFEGLEIPEEETKECPQECPQECSKECPQECSKECPQECPQECSKECDKKLFNFINSIKEDSIIGTIFKNEIYQNKIFNNHLQS